MNHVLTRKGALLLAPAACILLVAAAFLAWSDDPAFAQIVERIRQARSLACDIVTTTTIEGVELPGLGEEQTHRIALKMLADGERRAWLQEYEQNGHPVRALTRDDRVYLQMGDELRVINLTEPTTFGGAGMGPHEWLDRLLRVTEEADQRLPDETINGRPAMGFEIASWKLGFGTRPTGDNATPDDSSTKARIWVDKTNGLPVRLDTEQRVVTPAMKTHTVTRWENIQWNVSLDSTEFDPPQDAPAARKSYELAASNEEGFIAGMRAWLDTGEKAAVTFGKIEAGAKARNEPVPPELANIRQMAALDQGYPVRLDTMWLMSTFMVRAQFAALVDQVDQREPVRDDLSEQEREELNRQRARKLGAAGGEVAAQATLQITPVALFYQKLANDGQEPEYSGAIVSPGDGDKVLLRWSLDELHWRIIYGDLRVETVERDK